MNREIKFRAFDDGVMIYSHNNEINTDYFQLSWFFNKIREDAIVMQFTGLTDKNGKEIYSKDYVKQGSDYYRIEMCVGGFECIELKLLKKGGYIEGSTYSFAVLSGRYCEVIGNVFEDKNLFQ
jgi:uncharacterized phage protein (TIGR01671 family)